MSDASQKSVVLGNEWDEHLLGVVREVLKELGAQVVDHSSGMGGSQEIEVLDVVINDQHLRVETETFMGVTLSGPAEIVDKIQSAISARARG